MAVRPPPCYACQQMGHYLALQLSGSQLRPPTVTQRVMIIIIRIFRSASVNRSLAWPAVSAWWLWSWEYGQSTPLQLPFNDSFSWLKCTMHALTFITKYIFMEQSAVSRLQPAEGNNTDANNNLYWKMNILCKSSGYLFSNTYKTHWVYDQNNECHESMSQIDDKRLAQNING